MIPAPEQVWLVIEAIDLRAGIDGLSQRIQNSLGRSPCDGSAYAFRNRRGNRLKLLVWDGTGVWCCQRRLYRGHFTWPATSQPTSPPVCTLTLEQWRWLITGIDWQRLATADRHAPRKLAGLKMDQFARLVLLIRFFGWWSGKIMA